MAETTRIGRHKTDAAYYSTRKLHASRGAGRRWQEDSSTFCDVTTELTFCIGSIYILARNLRRFLASYAINRSPTIECVPMLYTRSHRITVIAALMAVTASLLALNGATAASAQEEPMFDGMLTTEGKLLKTPPSLTDGRWTLVMIWATTCHVCKAQKGVISEFHDAHKDKDAKVFGIALDGRRGLDDVNEYLSEHKASFPNYVWDFPSTAISYMKLTEQDLRGTPTYLLFDPKGELMGNNPGPITAEAVERFIARNS